MTKANLAYHILRIGLGITFLTMGLLIWQNPELYGSFLAPWAQNLVGNLQTTMTVVAVFDIALGILLISGWWTWLFGILGSLHLLSIIIGMSNFSDIAARDFGLLAAAVALTLWRWPKKNQIASDQSDEN